MELTLEQFDYPFSEDLIAHHPAEPRDQSKLLVLDRKTQKITHHHFFELPTLLQPGDVIVRNDTRVFPARLSAEKETGGKVEILLLNQVTSTSTPIWNCLIRPGLKQGQIITLSESDIKVNCIRPGKPAQLEFHTTTEKLTTYMERHGSTPTPPYIQPATAEAETRQRYQTTYATQTGSAAAPTAGLHFTSDLDAALVKHDIKIETVTLHVGLGTFAPVRETNIRQHQIHQEWCSLSKETAHRLTTAKQAGKRLIAVGTTTTRVLETAWNNKSHQFLPFEGSTAIYIYPSYQFLALDGLITNFHLPKSTLLMLVAAFVSHPNTPQRFSSFVESAVGTAYLEAAKHNYRFYSYGDAMLIL